MVDAECAQPFADLFGGEVSGQVDVTGEALDAMHETTDPANYNSLLTLKVRQLAGRF